MRQILNVKYSTPGFRHGQAQEMSDGGGRRFLGESSGATYRDCLSNLEVVFQNYSQTLEGFV